MNATLIAIDLIYLYLKYETLFQFISLVSNKMFQIIFFIPFVIAISGTNNGCYDIGTSCNKRICTKFPQFARNSCAKTCGFCGLTNSDTSSSSSASKSDVCYDKDSDCSNEICQNYPYTAKERCPKFCGLCNDSLSGNSGHLSSVISSSHQQSSSLKSDMIQSAIIDKERKLSSLCIDKDYDCTKEICHNYPFTAKERCAKTCGLCSGTSGIANLEAENVPLNGHLCFDKNINCKKEICHNYPFTAKEQCAKTCGFCSDNEGIIPPLPPSLSGNKPSATTEDCRDENSHCSEQSCLDYPCKARRECAKTCGFCGEKCSISELKPTPDNLENEGSIITLDDDDDSDDDDTGRRSFIQSTATSGHHSISRTGYESSDKRNDLIHGRSGHRPTQGIGDGSIGKRTDSNGRTLGQRPISEISDRSTGKRTDTISDTYVQQPTSQRERSRYPGRTGPCSDENQYCEKEDCYKYPRFAQRYCEKTCGYC
uniref:Bm8157, isoform c n=1 Tax=Brugia malayi TaxID=6279 RepID=A0A1I9FZT0_BRUMA|nr:Bm8157, isoform c [Brugia malayi]